MSKILHKRLDKIEQGESGGRVTKEDLEAYRRLNAAKKVRLPDTFTGDSLGMTLDEAKAILANSPARDDDFRTVQLAFGKVASRSGELLSAARERRLARERGEKANGKTVGGKATNKRPD